MSPRMMLYQGTVQGKILHLIDIFVSHSIIVRSASNFQGLVLSMITVRHYFLFYAIWSRIDEKQASLYGVSYTGG